MNIYRCLCVFNSDFFSCLNIFLYIQFGKFTVSMSLIFWVLFSYVELLVRIKYNWYLIDLFLIKVDSP